MNKFIPQNFKYRKIHKRVKIKKIKSFNLIRLKFGIFGLKILENGVISSTVFEAARRAITFKLKRMGKLYINGFPTIPLTSKPLGTRMGKGAGNIFE
jgi:large subunit ribosomal protein L16